jgi:hypothetical protein
MAITATDLTSGSDTTLATSYVTASITPTANRLVLLTTAASKATTPSQPTVSGAGLTWVFVSGFVFDTETTVTVNMERIDVFRALSASPGSGAVTINYGSNQTGCLWSIVEFDGIDTSGSNGANAVAQPTQTAPDPIPATQGSLTLAAAGNSNNRPFSAWAHETQEATNPRSGWTEIHDALMGSPANGLETQWRGDAFETTASASWATPSTFGGVALELVAAAAGGGQPALARFRSVPHVQPGRGGDYR